MTYYHNQNHIRQKYEHPMRPEIPLPEKHVVHPLKQVAELTPFILNKLIAKIEIGCLEIVDGEKQQQSTIVWRFTEGI